MLIEENKILNPNLRFAIKSTSVNATRLQVWLYLNLKVVLKNQELLTPPCRSKGLYHKIYSYTELGSPW